MLLSFTNEYAISVRYTLPIRVRCKPEDPSVACRSVTVSDACVMDVLRALFVAIVCVEPTLLRLKLDGEQIGDRTDATIGCETMTPLKFVSKLVVVASL